MEITICKKKDNKRTNDKNKTITDKGMQQQKQNKL